MSFKAIATCEYEDGCQATSEVSISLPIGGTLAMVTTPSPGGWEKDPKGRWLCETHKPKKPAPNWDGPPPRQ